MNLPKLNRNDLLRYGIPGILGAAAGFAYFYFVGCASGACPLTSNPWTSTAYGAAVGVLLVPRKRPNASAQNTIAPEPSKEGR